MTVTFYFCGYHNITPGLDLVTKVQGVSFVRRCSLSMFSPILISPNEVYNVDLSRKSSSD